ncbi:TLD protein [Cardiosporidium cionae]|uniref:Oxidation resistance protein 1 n=1 Tax=Cardiosporidium cionae TaxID=476202 RepID=A0ABQ7JDN4_9APIC|nr:TLD protein [Cardiosporidium cionae]|eukprot:KAF8821984.1 TLD protein [Cardiosporidium cionae]
MFDFESWYRYAANAVGEAGSKAATIAKEGFHLYRLIRPDYHEETECSATETVHLVQPNDSSTRQQHATSSGGSFRSGKIEPAIAELHFSKDNLESAIAKLPPHLLADSGSIFEAAVQPGAYPSTHPVSSHLPHRPSMISSLTAPLPSLSEDETPAFNSCKEHCYYKIDGTRVPGILTFTSECITFEPYTHAAAVLERGIGPFQLYIHHLLVEDFKWFLGTTDDGESPEACWSIKFFPSMDGRENYRGGELTLLYNLRERNSPNFPSAPPTTSQSHTNCEIFRSGDSFGGNYKVHPREEFWGTSPQAKDEKNCPRMDNSRVSPQPEDYFTHTFSPMSSSSTSCDLLNLKVDTDRSASPHITSQPPASVSIAGSTATISPHADPPPPLVSTKNGLNFDTMAAEWEQSSPHYDRSIRSIPPSKILHELRLGDASSIPLFERPKVFSPFSTDEPRWTHFPLIPSETPSKMEEDDVEFMEFLKAPPAPISGFEDDLFSDWPVHSNAPLSTEQSPPSDLYTEMKHKKMHVMKSIEEEWDILEPTRNKLETLQCKFSYCCVFQFDDFAKADQALCWLALFLSPDHREQYTITKSKENDPFYTKSLLSPSFSDISSAHFHLPSVQIKQSRRQDFAPFSEVQQENAASVELELWPPEENIFVPKVSFETPKGACPLLDHHVAEQATRHSTHVFEAEKFLSYRRIALNLPPSVAMCKWILAFCPKLHGISFSTFYRQVFEKGSCILLVRDDGGTIFGGFMEELRLHPKYYGSSSTFVFTFKKLPNDTSNKPQIHVYHWAMKNEFFVFSNAQTITIGGGGRYALTIDHDFSRGSSTDCPTFNNPCLASTEDFKVKDFQVWVFDTL